MPYRVPPIEVAGKRYQLVSRYLLQGASSGVVVPATTPNQSIQQSIGPQSFAANRGGMIRIKHMFALISDATGPTSSGAVLVQDGNYGLQLALSNSGPYVTVFAYPVLAGGSIGLPLVSTQGLVASVSPQPDTADLIAFDWNPVQPDFAPSYQLFLNYDVSNTDSADHTVVNEISALIEEYALETRLW